MSQSGRPEEQQSNFKKIELVKWIIPLVIAVIGAGASVYNGILQSKKPVMIDLKIDFDRERSFFAIINSANPYIKGRPAVIMYRVTLTGNGQSPFYPKDIDVSLRCNKKIEKVWQIIPPKYKGKVPYLEEEHITFFAFGEKEVDSFNYVGLEDFTPNKDKGIRFGEAYKFSYAGFVKLNHNDLEHCNKITVKATDHLNNTFAESMDAVYFTKSFHKSKTMFLCMKQFDQCKANTEEAFESLRQHK